MESASHPELDKIKSPASQLQGKIWMLATWPGSSPPVQRRSVQCSGAHIPMGSAMSHRKRVMRTTGATKETEYVAIKYQHTMQMLRL
jgi:hypothetical protein